MKISIQGALLLICGIVLLQSCKKSEHDTQYITLNESISSGSTYSLNLRAYADVDEIASITSQAAHYAVSQIDTDALTADPVYHYSAGTKLSDTEKVVITVNEHHRNGRGNGCDDDNVAVISINFTIK